MSADDEPPVSAELVFSPHAPEEMAVDTITTDDVYVVGRDYDDMYVQESNGGWVHRRMMEDGRALIAVVEPDEVTVRTVWWDRRASRRRRRIR